MTQIARPVLWHGVDPFSAELFQLSRRGAAWELSGVALVDLPEGGTEVRYELRVDERWHSRQLHVEMTGAYATTLDLVGDGGGSWSIGTDPDPRLDGCIDLDLGVSPSTNTLPIRRLDPPVGDIVTTRVAWVRFPELTVQPDEQSYERLAERYWRFRSDDFVAEIEVDDDGIVARYGDLWTRVPAGAV